MRTGDSSKTASRPVGRNPHAIFASTADGIIYQMSGSTEVSIGGEAKTLSPTFGRCIVASYCDGHRILSKFAAFPSGETYLQLPGVSLELFLSLV